MMHVVTSIGRPGRGEMRVFEVLDLLGFHTSRRVESGEGCQDDRRETDGLVGAVLVDTLDEIEFLCESPDIALETSEEPGRESKALILIVWSNSGNTLKSPEEFWERSARKLSIVFRLV